MPKAAVNKTGKNKFYYEDFGDKIAEKYFLRKINENMTPKSKHEANGGDDDFGGKILKRNSNINCDIGFKDKILNIMKQQSENEKQANEHLIKTLKEVLVQIDSDFVTFKEHEQHLQQINIAKMKCIQQAIYVHDQRMQALGEILSTFEKQCEERDNNNQRDYKKLETNIGEEMSKLQKKFIMEARQEQLKTVQRSIMKAFDHHI